MTVERYFLGVSFVPLDGNGYKFFGFSEFLAGLALMVLAWTIADVRYRFRVRTAPVPLLGITFSVVTAVGVLTLLTDLWRAEQWLVPQGNLFSPATWQAFLGFLFLITFFSWSWFGFIKPPKYSRYNADRFAMALYKIIINGSPSELAVVADEIGNSAAAIVRHAPDKKNYKKNGQDGEDQDQHPSKVEGYANDLLLLIADKRLCRVIVESSSSTVWAIFHAMEENKKYCTQVKPFAKNIVNEAIANKNSFLYHESSGHHSGLLGYHKPLSLAMFSNYEMVDTIGTLLSPDFSKMKVWDEEQLEAYCRILLITIQSFVKLNEDRQCRVFSHAKQYIEMAVSNLYMLNNNATALDSKEYKQLSVIVNFIEKLLDIIKEANIQKKILLRRRKDTRYHNITIYDDIAELIFEVIASSSTIMAPSHVCWWIHYNTLWTKIFNFDRFNSHSAKIIKLKVRRLIYNEINDMKYKTNFKGARILGFCLNVMGFSIIKNSNFNDTWPLHKAILSWTKKNYIFLHRTKYRVADACLVDGITYDSCSQRLVRTYPYAEKSEPEYVYFELDPDSPDILLHSSVTDDPQLKSDFTI